MEWKVIEKMAKYIEAHCIENICKKKTEDCYADMYGLCKDCIIDYFIRM